MDEKLSTVKQILIKYHQEHLLRFYSELTEEQKVGLLNQILKINFEEILSLYTKSKSEVLNSTEEIEPLPYCDKSTLSNIEINKLETKGIKAIKSGVIGVITLAGGQGSRLGFQGPKGTFCIDTTPKKSLFEILCNYIKTASFEYNVNIPWYIMTSTENYFDTINFFEQNNFFGYDPYNVIFFNQENMPIIDVNGNLVLSEIYKINFASNGNGNLFYSLKKRNLLKDMEQKNLQWLFVGGVDNILLDPLDPVFIGYTINSNFEIGSKTLFKDNPSDKSWIFARKNNMPAIVDCENFTEEISKLVDENGNFLYRETNMLAHLFSINSLNKMSNIQLPYHRAFRKNAFINDEGMKEIPDKPNIYKFEQFVFDAFSHFDNIALFRVNKDDEFAPIKSFTGPYNPEDACNKYLKKVLKQ